MRRRALTRVPALLAILVASGLLCAGPAAAAEYDIASLETSLSSAQAGEHADFTVRFELTGEDNRPNGFTRDVFIRLPPGLVGNPLAVPQCPLDQFIDRECSQDSQVGINVVRLAGTINKTLTEPIYNMPSTGGDIAARFGFWAEIYPIFVNVRLDPDDHTLVAAVEGAPSTAELFSSEATFWGVPAADSHNSLRLTPTEAEKGELPPGGREAGVPEVPFMSNPTQCGVSHQVTLTAVAYEEPHSPKTKSAPFPTIGGCDLTEFNPTAAGQPTTFQASSATGLDYRLDLPTKGLEVPNVKAPSHFKRHEVVLPEGMTVNPSAAVGLGVCSEADLARETYDSLPNAGCPETSKLGSIRATTPVLDRAVAGSLYLAKPYENRFGSLMALYLVLKVPDRGVLVRVAGRVTPDPRTGRLVTVFDDVPQLPVSTVELTFREGARAPLVTPPSCGSFEVLSNISPWARPGEPVGRSNAFGVTSGPDRGPCPSPNSFSPGFSAGTESNTAGNFSPFHMRLTRGDADQDLTRFSAKLPPGLAAKLAGTTQCPDAAIARARARSGPREGRLELASPSCPATSEIGDVLAGAGVGQVLTFATGKVYLAGPFNGAPLSVVGIVPAVAGPFDVGTVVTRQALRIDPRTAEVQVDGSSSDPIPHILAGIPLKVRDIRVAVDRPNFTFNPTSCERFSVDATLWAGGLDVFSSADDSPFPAPSPFQAAECRSLAFKPRLDLSLKGGTKRGGHPALRGVYRPRAGDANLKDLVLRLPSSAFLDQAHIGTICTRVQFAAGAGNGEACPPRAIYGKAKAFTPILDEPLEGPVFLRSSNNNLPDFVASLRGLVDVEAVARIDSVRGGIRATFSDLPDAPITKVIVDMRGGKKGLIVNSRNLCAGTNRADGAFSAQNGRRFKSRPAVRAVGCGKGRKDKRTAKRSVR
jgi:hypothetical protein